MVYKILAVFFLHCRECNHAESTELKTLPSGIPSAAHCAEGIGGYPVLPADVGSRTLSPQKSSFSRFVGGDLRQITLTLKLQLFKIRLEPVFSLITSWEVQEPCVLCGVDTVDADLRPTQSPLCLFLGSVNLGTLWILSWVDFGRILLWSIKWNSYHLQATHRQLLQEWLDAPLDTRRSVRHSTLH